MSTPQCPECLANVVIEDDAMIGEIYECEDCGVELELVNTLPLTLALAPEVEEDWGE